MKRLLLAWDKLGRRRAVGPVHTDASIAKLRAEMADAGWTVDEEAVATSASEFRHEQTRRTS